MINFDLLIAGCNTRCKHCYVNGGPGPMMGTGDALRCMEQLDAIASFLPERADFNLDHEPINHPEIGRILSAAAATKHIAYYHHGMTSGWALMRREDRNAVIERYLACGYDYFGLTIHGGATLHDEITRRKGAYETMIAAGEFLKAHGVQLEVSLMLNRFFPEQTEALSELLDRLQPDTLISVLPIYSPHVNMPDYEPYQPSIRTVEALHGWLEKYGQDAEALFDKASRCCAASAKEELKSRTDLDTLFSAPQDEWYLSVHPDCLLYFGNSGAETQCLGDLSRCDPMRIAETIRSLPANRDYDAFYNRSALPSTERLIAALERLPHDTAYGDFPSVIYRGLAACGTPTKILSLGK